MSASSCRGPHAGSAVAVVRVARSPMARAVGTPTVVKAESRAGDDTKPRSVCLGPGGCP